MGVPFDPTPRCIIEAKQKYVNDSGKPGNNGYGDPRGLESLRVNLTNYYNTTYGISSSLLTPDNVTIVPGGTSNALSLVFEQLLRGADGQGEIAVLSPYFGPYEGMIKLSGGKINLIPTNKNFQPDLGLIERSINSKTRGILINSPNNPTGQIYTQEDIDSIIQIAAKKGIPVISDEVYEKFVYVKSKKFHPIVQFMNKYDKA